MLPSSGSAATTVYRVEYVLSDYFSVIAESDIEGNWSGDLKVRWRFP
jgi:hypothetical protein